MIDEKDGSNTFEIVGESQAILKTNIGTHHFTSYERLIFAITDDDIVTFDRLQIPLEDLVVIEFECNMNVLNFAIEHERVAICEHLSALTEGRPDLRERLLTH